jgi:hypothetical protein
MVSRRYEKSPNFRGNTVRHIREEPEEGIPSAFFVTRVVRGWKTSYNVDLRSWVTPLEGSRYATFEIAYRYLCRLADIEIGQYKVETLEELINESRFY